VGLRNLPKRMERVEMAIEGARWIGNIVPTYP
jgi:hypothetical protein